MISNPSRRSELILIYHAVVEKPLDVADPCFIDAATFGEQMTRLLESFDIVSLSEYVGQLGKRRSRPVAALTFDDGFLNNYTVALPILEELRIPATVFPCTGLIDTDRTMWFCEINRAVTLTDKTSLSWAGEKFDLSTNEARAKASIHLQSALKSRSRSDLRIRLKTLLDDLGAATPEALSADSPYRMLTSDALRSLSASGLIEIGAHTRTHPILTRCSRDEQEEEITGSIRDVEELSRITVPYLRLSQRHARRL